MPSFPTAVGYVWRTYSRLRRRTKHGFNGPQPIDFQEIDAFVRVSRFPLRPWEVQIIEDIDDAFLQPAYRKAADVRNRSTSATPMVSARDGAAVSRMMRSMGVRKKSPQKKGG